jgi:hypothetical protein
MQVPTHLEKRRGERLALELVEVGGATVVVFKLDVLSGRVPHSPGL